MRARPSSGRNLSRSAGRSARSTRLRKRRLIACRPCTSGANPPGVSSTFRSDSGRDAPTGRKDLSGGTHSRIPMQIRLLEKQKDSVRLEITNADDTVIYPLITALLKDPDVEDALYYTGHPQLDKPVLTIKVKKGNPQAALKRVAEGLAADFGGVKGVLEKELA